jgi:quercetin dioxygenase-like cupin family protein
MRAFQACLALALVTGIPFGANAQSTESVVKFPNDMEFKAPLSAAPQVAVLYGDPTKADVYVTRIKLAPGLKVTPHWHPDPWRTVVVLSGTLYFGGRRAVGRKQAQSISGGDVLIRAAENTALRLGQGRRGDPAAHRHGTVGHDPDPAKAISGAT